MERKVFAWIVRHLHWLARVPGLPHFFDAALFAWTMCRRPQRRVAMETLEETILRSWPCRLGTHHLGGSAYRLHGREIAHLHGNGLLDVRLDRANAATFVAAGLAEPHHLLGHSVWVSYWLESSDDIGGALTLIRAAAAS